MKNLVAQLQGNVNLEKYADVVNNGRTDGVYFYVNGKNVSVSYVYNQLSEKTQIEELTWFLKGHSYIYL